MRRRFPREPRLALAQAVLILVAVLTPAIVLGADVDLAPDIKATFLYKFAPFVEWPANAFDGPQSPLTICVVGDDPVARVIDRDAAGQKDGDRPVTVRHLDRAEPRTGCHVVYLAGGDAQAAQLMSLRDVPVLTVTDSRNGPAKGIVTFVVDNNRVHFDIDDRAAAEAGLSISSRLLGLARNVTPRN